MRITDQITSKHFTPHLGTGLGGFCFYPPGVSSHPPIWGAPLFIKHWVEVLQEYLSRRLHVWLCWPRLSHCAQVLLPWVLYSQLLFCPARRLTRSPRPHYNPYTLRLRFGRWKWSIGIIDGHSVCSLNTRISCNVWANSGLGVKVTASRGILPRPGSRLAMNEVPTEKYCLSKLSVDWSGR